ncbi:MAG: Protein containing PKD domain [Anaerolineaceae bacterium]|nr:MAG: Protein containing PKD domain [Anaerolineaceae bacterium]
MLVTSGCLNPGDEILLINVKGAPGKWGNTGHYEFLHVGGVIGGTLYFNTPKNGFYGDNPGDDTNIGVYAANQHVLVMRVPNYADVTVNGTLTGTAFDGYRFGLFVFRVDGTLAGSGVIYADYLGWRGGAGGTGPRGAGLNEKREAAPPPVLLYD